MSDTATIVESVVREVLAALATKNEAPAPCAAKPECGENGEKSPPPAAPPGELAIASRVVTMQELTGRLAGVRRVVVSPEAIVTPAVRDELIRRGIALDRAAPATAATPVRLIVVTSGTKFDPASLLDGLARDGLRTEHTPLDCIIASADHLAHELAEPNTLGVLLTKYAAAGVCLANRLPGVRAVGAVDAPSAASATAAVGANLLVVDPAAGTFFQLKQIVVEFCRAGVRPCPAPFRKRLA